jgi:hypothetical protein
LALEQGQWVSGSEDLARPKKRSDTTAANGRAESGNHACIMRDGRWRQVLRNKARHLMKPDRQESGINDATTEATDHRRGLEDTGAVHHADDGGYRSTQIKDRLRLKIRLLLEMRWQAQLWKQMLLRHFRRMAPLEINA